MSSRMNRFIEVYSQLISEHSRNLLLPRCETKHCVLFYGEKEVPGTMLTTLQGFFLMWYRRILRVDTLSTSTNKHSEI